MMPLYDIGPLRPDEYDQAIRFFSNAHPRHQHVDWQALDAWLHDPQLTVRVARQGHNLRALMAVTIHQPLLTHQSPVGWLRFIALGRTTDRDLQRDLWSALADALCERQISKVALLVMDRWLLNMVEALGFTPYNVVVTMERRRGTLLDIPVHPYAFQDVKTDADLNQVVHLDSLSFNPTWQYSKAILTRAGQQSASFKLLMDQEQPIAYQLTTKHGSAAHLSRLAVHPSYQGQGIGTLVVLNMLHDFIRKGVHTVTVNTQQDNLSSQRLYQNLGFQFTGFDVPVWQIDLPCAY